MLFSLRSMVLFSSLMAASTSPCCRGLVPVPEAPVVTPAPVFAPAPEDCAVPALLVPGGGEASRDELPAPLGSLPELFCPAALAGPGGTPLIAEVPAPAEPAFGVPTELLPVVAPPALPPPALPPPLLCANTIAGNVRMASAVTTVVIFLVIEYSLFP